MSKVNGKEISGRFLVLLVPCAEAKVRIRGNVFILGDGCGRKSENNKLNECQEKKWIAPAYDLPQSLVLI